MKIIQPATIEPADVTSNVAITETAWTAGTYTLGQQRYVGVDLYEVAASSTTDEPTAGAALDPPSWVIIGQVNKWRMFNGALYQQTMQTAGPIQVSVEFAERVNAIAVLNCLAAQAVVTMRDAEGNVVYENTVSLIDNSLITNWFQWFFGSRARFPDFVLMDLPTYAGGTVTIELSSGANDVACGALVLGDQISLGSTGLNYTVRNRFFSRRERSIYGAFLDLLKRPVAREGTFNVLMDTKTVPRILKLLSDREILPTIYVGDEGYRQSILFGFPDEPEVAQITQGKAMMNLTILGQT